MWDPDSIQVEALTIEEVLPVRHKVLWPHMPINFCRVDDDDKGEHFGVKMDGNIVVCVASLFTNSSGEIRLRKFATLPEYQGQGIGSSVLQHLVNYSKEKGATLFWFDARESAIQFYGKFGFSVEGERFYKSNLPYFRMSQSL